MDTPNYIKSLLAPNTKKPQGRKVWSIDLETVWLPFFTATNTMGDTSIAHDALGCPMRLAYDKAGAVRFSTSGKPVIRVAKELSDNVRMVRDNFQANLLNYAGEVMTEHPDEYKTQLELSAKAGQPIAVHDSQELSKAIEAIKEAEAEAQETETTPQTETKELVEVS
jgi:hypothetical protein